jgi:hypothetical protein
METPTLFLEEIVGSWPSLVNREWMRFEKACLELHPKCLLQDTPIISPKMAMSGKVRMKRQVSETSNRLQVGCTFGIELVRFTQLSWRNQTISFR